MSRPEVQRFQQTAVAALKKGDYEAALRACAALEQLEPDNPDWPKRTAKVLRRMDRQSEEAQALLRASELEVQRGGELRAMALLKQIVDLFPSHAEARARIARLQRTSAQAPRAAGRRPPAPSQTPVQAASWRAVQQGGLERLDLRDVMTGAARRTEGIDIIPLDDDDEALELSLEDVMEPTAHAAPPRASSSTASGAPPRAPSRAPSGPPPVALHMAARSEPAAPAPQAEATEDALILLVEEEFREAERTNRALSSTPLFSDLDEAQFARVLMQAKHEEHDKNATIFRQGDAGDTLYVVAEGRVGVIDEGPPRRGLSQLAEGDVFGEIALLTEQPRSATVVALAPTALIGLDRGVVAEIGTEDPTFLATLLRFFRDRSVSRVLQTSPFFQTLSDNDRQALKRRFRFLEVNADAELVSRGSQPEGLLALLSGRAEATAIKDGIEVVLGHLGPGDLVGEMSLMSGQPAMGTVRATSKCYAVELPATDFFKILSARPQAKAYVEKVVASRRRASADVLQRERDAGRVAF